MVCGLCGAVPNADGNTGDSCYISRGYDATTHFETTVGRHRFTPGPPRMYTDIGSGVYGYRVTIVQIGSICTDIGSDLDVQADIMKTRIETTYGFSA